MAHACIGIGSNLGDRAEHIDFARAALERLPRCDLLAFSHVYETEPVGPVDQDKFLNAAALLRTDLEPIDLLHRLLTIEAGAGRRRERPMGPRTLDLDLLLYGDVVIDTDELTVPHPRMHERRFVLRPLLDLNPALHHPILKLSVSELLARLESPRL